MSIKILIAEHDPVDIDLLKHELTKGDIDYIAEIVKTEKQYEEALHHFVPDMILSDYTFPSFDGYTAFKIKERVCPEVPFICISGTIGEERSIEFIKQGVTDFVLKDRLLTLPIKIKRALNDAQEKRDRLKSEQTHIRSENQLARAQQIAHIGSWEFDFTTKKVLLSAEACRIFGMNCEENEQNLEDWLSFIHEDDRHLIAKGVNALSLNSGEFGTCYRIKNRNGSVRHINSEWKSENDENGQKKGVYGIVHDITEKKLAEAQLEFHRNNLYALINNTNNLMWSVDRNFNLITANRPFEEITTQINGKPLEKGNNIMGKESSAEMIRQFTQLYERAFAGEIFTEIVFMKEPVETWNEISFFPIYNGAEVIGTACNSRDITERKRIEKTLETQNAELTKTNLELDRFVYITSHDLRSPLTSILGLLGLIENESEEANTLHYAGMIRTSIDRLDEFIRNILNYSKNNRTELNIEKINLNSISGEIVESLRNIQGAEGINFHVDIKELFQFYSDLFRFRTVVENLVANAIKYHRQEHPGRFITITGICDGENLHLRISDNGIGIAAQYHSKIFEMFFRMPGKTVGSGIGLYIVKEAVEKLNGEITIESELGKGTSVFIILKNFVPAIKLIENHEH